MTQGIFVKNLTVSLTDTVILKDISCRLNHGELVALIGPNGAGKSTLLRAILGLLPPDSGTVTIDATPIKHLIGRSRGKKMAYAPQGSPVFWPMEVFHVIALGRIPHINPWQKLTAADETAIHAAMQATETEHLAKRVVTTLSGGERARVMLARAIVTNAPYLMADEPIASLDPYHQLKVMQILSQQAKAGIGVMVVLHDLALALRYADRVILMHEGGILSQGLPKDVLNDHNLKTAFNIKVTRWQDEDISFIAPR